MKNKDYILRNIEYMIGGMNALLKVIPEDDEESKGYRCLLNEWSDTLYSLMEDIEGEDYYAENS